MCLVQHYIDENGISYYGFDAFWRWLLDGCPKRPSEEEVLRRSRKSGQFGPRSSAASTQQGRAPSTDMSAWNAMAEDYYPRRKNQRATDQVEMVPNLQKPGTEHQQPLLNQGDENV
ncbi:hypothetical protein GAYE_PCTG75G1604 [Galdieria yellowstonensis]|uniref:Uncharacterized protein n=1 Tax=Galdieria yellowstonensis TaxID=3028027 RepID=A0AAV9I8S7_9RHOD|nr:hypothetical protein GAYE_PCTG75G1604 [Galdieria yellowstonensis]